MIPKHAGWRVLVVALVAASLSGTWHAITHLGEVSAHPAQAAESRDVVPDARYAELARQVETLVAHELRDKRIPALSLALVDDQGIVWARGFGLADPEKKVAANARTIYKAGSVSKLFTDMAVLQLVERSEVDIDAPVTRYLQDFHPRNPFEKNITLRQLMCHRAGLVREPPVGHYFDSTRPTLSATVASLNRTELVYAPESRFKYSNAGIAVVGYVVERLKKQAFAKYMKAAVLQPLGMTESAFEEEPAMRPRLAHGVMWGYDRPEWPAPEFPLGMLPAGSLHASVLDLAQLVRVLNAGGRGPGGAVIQPETLEQMWTPQFVAAGEKSGYGFGFRISEFEGERRADHGGAIYGFATTLSLLTKSKLGVVVMASKDGANGVTDALAERILRGMLAVRAGRPLPPLEIRQPVPDSRAREVAGRYAGEGAPIELVYRGGRLEFRSQLRADVKQIGDAFVLDGAVFSGPRFTSPEPGVIRFGGRERRREPARTSPPDAPPAAWLPLIGEYGWDYNVLYILEKDGALHAHIEWFFEYPLRQLATDVFAFPGYGLYHDEKLIFQRDAKGKVTGVEAASVLFPRRAVGPEEGAASFRITPLKPIAQLERQALTARPPPQPAGLRTPDLVEVTSLDSAIKLDIRYAGKDNFLSTPVYSAPRAFLQRPAAEALVRVNRRLRELGYGLLIHDAYRPWYVTKIFWDATPASGKAFVADPKQGSRHNRGCAVDLTLYDRATGRAVEMPGVYDEMSPRSFPDYPGGTARQRWLRDLLRDAMEAQGFTVVENEWWHFDYKDWRSYPVLNLPFEKLLTP